MGVQKLLYGMKPRAVHQCNSPHRALCRLQANAAPTPPLATTLRAASDSFLPCLSDLAATQVVSQCGLATSRLSLPSIAFRRACMVLSEDW